jgi:non-canonical (house-cleaning) NTP pyrophosphatase
MDPLSSAGVVHLAGLEVIEQVGDGDEGEALLLQTVDDAGIGSTGGVVDVMGARSILRWYVREPAR